MYTRHHATLFVPTEAAAPVEALRRRWDATMAAQIAAHVTLAYPQESPDPDLLVARLAEVCRVTAPLRLRLGGMAMFGRPDDGVYVEVEDVDGDFERMHTALVVPPMEPIVFPPHVTVVHPRTSDQGAACWREEAHRRFDTTFVVREATITAWDGSRWVTLHRFALAVAEPFT